MSELSWENDNKMKRKILYRLSALFLGALCLSGCADTAEVMVEHETSRVEMAQALPQAGEAAEVTKETGKKARKGTIRVATVGSPNTEILQQAAVLLEEKGYQLKIEVCEDYLTPNQMVVEGKVDCNYYQHEAFLERYNIEQQSELFEVAKIHDEPLAIYSQSIENLEQVENGMQVAISNNPTAFARALWLLQDAELIKLVSDADMNTVKDDVTENPYKLEFVLVEESELAGKLQEVDLVVCSKDILMQKAIDGEDFFLAGENKDSVMVQQLAHVLVAADAENENANILAETLLSEEMRQFVDTKYQGGIVIMQDVLETGDENTEDKES